MSDIGRIWVPGDASSDEVGVMADQNAPPAAPWIPTEQMNLPVTLATDSKPVILAQLLQPDQAPVVAVWALNPKQRVELTVKRIEARPRYQLAMLGAGLVDQARAIREVKARSEVGHTLIELEQRLIASLIEGR